MLSTGAYPFTVHPISTTLFANLSRIWVRYHLFVQSPSFFVIFKLFAALNQFLEAATPSAAGLSRSSARRYLAH